MKLGYIGDDMDGCVGIYHMYIYIIYVYQFGQ